jgi:hypothetical protein
MEDSLYTILIKTQTLLEEQTFLSKLIQTPLLYISMDVYLVLLRRGCTRSS